MIDWDVAAVAAKAVLYATSLTAGGGILFLAIFGASLEDRERLRVMRFVRIMALAALVVTVARVMILSAMLGGELASMWDWSVVRIVIEGSEGDAAAVRSAGLIGIAALSFRSGATQAVAVLGAMMIAASFALVGHTGSVEPGELARFLVAVHVLAVSYWVGALVPLYLVSASPDASRVGAILKRFGDVAVFVVGALIGAGVALLWLILGSFEAILGSAYGRLVLVKLSFVVGLLALAAINKLRLTARVAGGDHGAAASLRFSIAGELTLAAAIFVASATFTTVVGPPEMD